MKRILLVATMMASVAATPALAFTADGYVTGGGAGEVKCARFLNEMASARQNGGVRSQAGVPYITGFVSYLLGYVTAYNAYVPGVYDALAPLNPDRAENALYAMEKWCGDNPAAKFDDAIRALLLKLNP